jgi:uncharacterized protein
MSCCPASAISVHRLSKAEARRIAVRAQLLDAPRPTDLVEVVRQLTLLQIDPTAAIAPSADLVAWSRLGSDYQPAHLKQALEQDRTLFELDALVRPMSDLGLYLTGAGTTIPSGATSSSGCAALDRWPHVTSRTRASCLGPRPGGRTTATSRRCWSS